MAKTSDDSPAFPTWYDLGPDSTLQTPGLTKREFYAGLAMTKLNAPDYNTLADMCSDAFAEADAMLAEAKKREEEKPDGPE